MDSQKITNKIINKTIIISITFTLFISLLTIYLLKEPIKKTYKQNQIVDYKVYLKENNFFEKEYLEKNNQYISSIIKNIEATFIYKIEKETTYKYKIIQTINVIDKQTKNNIYKKQELIDEKEENEINQTLLIDYNKYNELINKFKQTYEIGNIEATLTLTMNIEIDNPCKTTKTLTITIPLTTNTVKIDTTIDPITQEIICKEKQNKKELIPIITTLLINIYLIIRLIIYIRKNRTNTYKYKIKLKKIKQNYKDYIQKIEHIKLEEYEIIKLETFKDLIEIEEKKSEPILMIEKEEKTTFIILNNSIAYLYTLKVEKWKDTE